MQRTSALERQPRRAGLEQPHGVIVAHRCQHELRPARRSAVARPSHAARPSCAACPACCELLILLPRNSGAGCWACAKPCPRPFSCPPGLPASSPAQALGLLPAQPANRCAVPHVQRRAPHALRACARSTRAGLPVRCCRHVSQTDGRPVTGCQRRRRRRLPEAQVATQGWQPRVEVMDRSFQKLSFLHRLHDWLGSSAGTCA